MSENRLTDLSCLRELMTRHGIMAKKKYGQNFLVNAAVPRRIALEGCADPSFGVLEIGPGMGTLTVELCQRAKRVVALEIDRTLLPVLEETLSEHNNVRVICADVMKTDLKKLCDEEFSGCSGLCVCANLPYYITSPVLMYLLESGVPFESVTVMVQKEVADRLTAPAGSAEYGAITASVAYYGRAAKLFTVSSGSFFPPPKVDSAVVKISLYRESPFADCDKSLLDDLIKTAFGQRRKTLCNTLKSILDEKGLAVVRETLSSLGFPADVRGEKLSIGDYAVLCRALSQYKSTKDHAAGG